MYGHIFRIIKRVTVSVFFLPINDKYYLLILHTACFSRCKCSKFPPFGTFVDHARQGEKCGSIQNQINHPAHQLCFFPAGSLTSQLPSILSLIFWLPLPYFKERKLHNTNFFQAVGNIFNLPEIADVW